MDAMAGLSRGALVLDWTRCRGPMYCLHWMSGCTMRCDAPGLARETRPPAIVPSVDSHAAQSRIFMALWMCPASLHPCLTRHIRPEH